jgi:hypothetical protein
MMVLRLLVILFGVIALGSAALIAAMVEPSNAYGDALMYFVFFVMACQAVMGLGCIVAGVWGPVQRWMEARAQRH